MPIAIVAMARMVPITPKMMEMLRDSASLEDEGSRPSAEVDCETKAARKCGSPVRAMGLVLATDWSLLGNEEGCRKYAVELCSMAAG